MALLDHLSRKPVILAGIMVLAITLRLYHYTANPLWIDEGWTLYVSQHGWIQGMFLDVHPPIHYWLVKAATSLFGASEAVIRMPSLIFGIIGVALIYFFTVEYTDNEWAGLLAAGILAVSPDAIFHSQDARSYTLWLVVFMVFGILYLRAIHKPDSGRLWIYTGIAAGVLMWVHYWSIFPILLLGLYALWRNRKHLAPILTGFAVFIGLIIPLIPVAIRGLTIKTNEGWTIFEPWNVIIQDTWLTFTGGNILLGLLFFWATAIGLVVLIDYRDKIMNFEIAAVLFAGTAVIFLLMSPWFMVIPKYAMYLVPFIYSLVGLGVCTAASAYTKNRRWLAMLIVWVRIIMAATSLPSYYAQTNRDGWYDHNSELTNVTHGKPVAIIANPGLAMQWAYYYNGTTTPFRSDEELKKLVEENPYGLFVFVPASEIPPDLPEAQQIDQYLHEKGVPVGDYRGFRGWYVNG